MTRSSKSQGPSLAWLLTAADIEDTCRSISAGGAIPIGDLARTLNLPKDHYAPGKIHSRLDLGRDGRLYFATHRGSEKAAIDSVGPVRGRTTGKNPT